MSRVDGRPLPATWREPVEAQGLLPARQGGAPFALVPVIPTDDDGEALPERAAELRTGPWSLLLAAALKTAPASFAEELVEDSLLRRSDAALSTDERVRLRPLADQVAALETEYLAAGVRYHDAESEAPRKDDWNNVQHYLEAMKVHERRMDRLQRGVRDAHDRYTKAVLLLERARTPAALPAPGHAPQASGVDSSTSSRALGVEVEVDHASGETSRVRVGTRG